MLRAAAAAVLVGVLPAPVGAEAPAAIYVHGHVYTVDPARPWVEAFAVSGGRFHALGSDAEIRALAGPGTDIVDLEGHMVLPGLHDMHVHPVLGAMRELYECGFPFTATVAEIVAVVGDCAATVPPGEWIRGGSWAAELLEASEPPDRRLLDAVAPDHPVLLIDSAYHNAWLNSRALARLGIGPDTPDPYGGTIVRDTAGRPTGLLMEAAAYDALQGLPARDPQQYRAAVQWVARKLASYGVTAMKDAVAEKSALVAYRAADLAGELTLRIAACLPWSATIGEPLEEQARDIEERARFASTHVFTDFVKIFVDGIPPGRTAVFVEPYLPDASGKDFRGELHVPAAELAAQVTRFDAAGLTVKMHAVGDGAVRAALDAIAAARRANGDSGLRHEVAHATYVHADDVPRFGELGAVAELSPILWHPGPLVDAMTAVLGSERGDHPLPIRSIHAAGGLMVYGSDWPAVSPSMNPWPGLEAMVTRRDPYGHVPGALWPEQRLELADAIAVYTLNGARAMRDEHLAGSIAPGKSADFVVIDRNLFEIAADAIGETEVLLTVFEGRTVYRRE